MNIRNIQSISEKLQGLGFEASIYQQLLQHVSFRSLSFTIRQFIRKEKDSITFHFYFERSGDYHCLYYDAVLIKEIAIPEVVINDIDTRVLDKKMQDIEWNALFGATRELSTGDAEEVESVIEQINGLYGSDARDIAESLQVKHWLNTCVENFVPNLRFIKNRFEISQRFYFGSGSEGISVDEAFRFLNNRWLEKRIRLQRLRTLKETSEALESRGKQKSSKGR